jgi:hypothetical protein
MKAIFDWVMWALFAAMLLLSYPFIFNKRDDDDL